jgi:DedD protein
VAESHEPSYYEIALTNRQVVVAFVVLLVCLLSAFFSGVWIGRESGARAAEQQVVRNTPPPQATPEGQNLEELEFFGSREKAAQDRTASDTQEQAPAAVDTTLLEDVQERKPAAEPVPSVEEPAEEEPAVAIPGTQPDPAAERRERRNKRREAAEAAARAKAAPAPAAATPARTPRLSDAAAPAPKVAKGSVVIQVFSSADKAQADRIRTQLAGGGYKAFLSPVEKAGHTMYRVRIGPFSSRDDAQKTAEKVRKGYKLDTWVTE